MLRTEQSPAGDKVKSWPRHSSPRLDYRDSKVERRINKLAGAGHRFLQLARVTRFGAANCKINGTAQTFNPIKVLHEMLAAAHLLSSLPVMCVRVCACVPFNTGSGQGKEQINPPQLLIQSHSFTILRWGWGALQGFGSTGEHRSDLALAGVWKRYWLTIGPFVCCIQVRTRTDQLSKRAVRRVGKRKTSLSPRIFTFLMWKYAPCPAWETSAGADKRSALPQITVSHSSPHLKPALSSKALSANRIICELTPLPTVS